jgi:hypothetical protein
MKRSRTEHPREAEKEGDEIPGEEEGEQIAREGEAVEGQSEGGEEGNEGEASPENTGGQGRGDGDYLLAHVRRRMQRLAI